jgi:predicted TIM-barrel fold metal-dependent hydrolase
MFVNHVHLLPPELRADGTLDAYLQLADEFGFEGAVCFAPFSYQYAKTNLSGNHNKWLHTTIKHRENLVGYGTLDPVKPAALQVRQIADLGFRGIKLHPPAQKFAIFGDWARDAYEAMEELGLIADFHLGIHWHRLKDYDPLDCDEIAWHYPNLNMVFEHVGGWHYYRQVLAIITNNKSRRNLYAGIASVLNKQDQRYWYLGPEGVDDCHWQIGADLLIYGLDFPYNRTAEIASDLEQIRHFNWPQKDIDALLGGNLKRLLGLVEGEVRTVGGDPAY